MSSNAFCRANRREHVRRIDSYPEFDDYEENDDDDICHDGYHLDEGFGSWEEVNRMFI